MKKLMSFGIIGIGILLIGHSLAFSQTEKAEKETLLKKQAQAEVVADSENYIIGSEDILYIHIWKEEHLSRTVPVRRDGIISLPLVDEIKAEGLTPLQLKEILAQRFKEFIGDPNITVMVMEANSFKVYLSGQIRNPGVYRLRSETSLLQIISMAGGFTDWANQKKILIIRKEGGKEKRITVNYKKIVKGEDPGSNIILKAGDTIIVPD
ncbi:MAG: polysaccharide biosynthesis/export family protein [Deltaproteobacteria bacterium]|nr:polysaccharide biosynthesis/export family protein [Deltaproteobacteria bacterium]